VQSGRDLGQVELWQESLERSRARRNQPARRRSASKRTTESSRRRPVATRSAGSPRPRPETRRPATSPRRQPAARRSLLPVAGLGGAVLAFLAVTVPNVLGGRSAQHQTRAAFNLTPSMHSPQHLRPTPSAHLLTPRTHRKRQPAAASAHAPASRVLVASTSAPAADVTPSQTVTQTAAKSVIHHAATPQTTTARSSTSSHADARSAAKAPKAPAAKAPAAKAPAAKPAPHRPIPAHPATPSPGYVNPLAHASVTPERIDQGVDYTGSGTLGAIGAASITYVGTADTGWPGAFIEFRLLGGPDSGRYVYYAEHIAPAAGLHVGQKVNAGQAIATITGDIEIGWAADIGTETYAAKMGQWSSGSDAESHATAAGKSFSALIASLGGPAGIVEG
jgi:hypothetical protein